MDKQDEKEEEEDAIAPRKSAHKQERVDTGAPRAVVEEKQQEGIEQVRRTANGAQRGKYRQYEDSQIIIEKIRSYRTQRFPDCEIIKLLDDMPRRTYYNYVKKVQEQDRQIMGQWMKENIEHVSEEMMIYRETLCQKLREIQAIIDDKNTLAKDKMQAIEQHIAISDKLVKFTRIGRSSDIESVKPDRFSIF
jgi:hypothetical protein